MSENTKKNIITFDTVKCVVDAFYTRVRNDEHLAPVFDGLIGRDDESWKPHLKTMYSFWSTLMSSTEHFVGDHVQYKGNPMKKHMDIPAFEENFFDRWLVLFHETAREFHTEDVAKHYIEASTRVAQSLRLALYYKPDHNMK